MKKVKTDKTSEYYRICPDEACKQEFMADHMNRVYCSDFCHNRTNNRKKKGERNANTAAAIEQKNQEDEIEKKEHEDKKRLNNLQILENLELQPKGSLFSIIFLKEQGFDFASGDAIFPLDSTGKFYYAQYGNYELYWVEASKILIFKP